MGYYAGDYYAGDITALARSGGSALAKLGGKALSFLKTPAGAATAAGAGGLAAGLAAGEDEERPRYRRMNVLNPRALRRSMRRVQGFARFARKTMSFTKRHKMKRRKRS
jgi:hypothetical protein